MWLVEILVYDMGCTVVAEPAGNNRDYTAQMVNSSLQGTETPTFIPKTSWEQSLGIACCTPARQTFTEGIPKTFQGGSGST